VAVGLLSGYAVLTAGMLVMEVRARRRPPRPTTLGQWPRRSWALRVPLGRVARLGVAGLAPFVPTTPGWPDNAHLAVRRLHQALDRRPASASA
jgi:hypothetical protein